MNTHFYLSAFGLILLGWLVILAICLFNLTFLLYAPCVFAIFGMTFFLVCLDIRKHMDTHDT